MTSRDSDVTWLREEVVDGRAVARIGRAGEHVVVELAGLGTLRARRDGSSRAFEAAPGASPTQLDKFARGLEAAYLRHLQGRLTLHGSAVGRDGIAMACVGASGAGKSSAAAELCLRGYLLCADDTVAVELEDGAKILPMQDVVWIGGRTRSSLGLPDASPSERKSPFTPDVRAHGQVPLGLIVRLRFDDEASGTPVRLRGAQVFTALSPLAFRAIFDDDAIQARDVRQLANLAARVPVYDLCRPRGSLAATGDLLEELFARHAARRDEATCR